MDFQNLNFYGILNLKRQDIELHYDIVILLPSPNTQPNDDWLAYLLMVGQLWTLKFKGGLPSYTVGDGVILSWNF